MEFVFGMVDIVQNHLQTQRERMRSLELERQLSAAQLQALQMQPTCTAYQIGLRHS